MATVNVVCGVVFNDNLVLLARRKPDKILRGYWEFPGGKIENEENGEKALERELQEELGMSVEIKSHLMTTIHAYENFKIKLVAYVCELKHSTGIRIDHDEIVWLPVDEVLGLKIAPADIAIAQYLVDNKDLTGQLLGGK